MSHENNISENLPDGLNIVDNEGNVIPHQGHIEIPSNQHHINRAELIKTHDYFKSVGKISVGNKTVEDSLNTENSITYCGDCGLPVPCAHTNGRRTFGY